MQYDLMDQSNSGIQQFLCSSRHHWKVLRIYISTSVP